MTSLVSPADLTALSGQLEQLPLPQALLHLTESFPGGTVLSTSFGQEDQVLTDMIMRFDLPVRVFTLDTGRLFEETYKVFQRTVERYGRKIEVYFPDALAVETLLRERGPFSFYESLDNRKECCRIRKVEPLRRALAGAQCWMTGLRTEQSETRNQLPALTWDESFGLYKYNPLHHWSLSEVEDYLQHHRVPYNSLHDRGFVSIGCQPCTRAIRPGEDSRAGRWWWEHNTNKECGLHDR
jgi:phosphoadenosine phosphosulfate reductase